jgi:hypothetical protein
MVVFNPPWLAVAVPALQAFSAWIHIAAVRIFVEAILRYGLPGTGQSTSGFQVSAGFWSAMALFNMTVTGAL